MKLNLKCDATRSCYIVAVMQLCLLLLYEPGLNHRGGGGPLGGL